LFAASAAPAYCQAPATPGATPAAAPATPSPEALALAQTLVVKSGTGRMSAMSGLTLPMARVMHELAVGQEHSNVVIHEAIMPTIEDHDDDLTEIQAQSYATILSLDDMKAAIAFYESQAGKDLVRAHPQIMMANMGGLNALFQKLMPEFKTKTDEVLKNHGWTTKP
jgi:mannose/fructose/N-acetylgalactosamine-specific phosphotransferase system component IIC